jgi:hypothetical protein
MVARRGLGDAAKLAQARAVLSALKKSARIGDRAHVALVLRRRAPGRDFSERAQIACDPSHGRGTPLQPHPAHHDQSGTPRLSRLQRGAAVRAQGMAHDLRQSAASKAERRRAHRSARPKQIGLRVWGA